MKQLTGVLVLIVLLFAPQMTFATGTASMTLEPTQKIVEVGTSFDIQIRVNPNGESVDTVRANLSFDEDLLKVDHFTLGETFPRISPSNTIDNDAGTFSQGGFTLEGPVTTSGVFGTVTLIAKAAGSATVSVLDTSRVISDGEEKINTSALGSTTVTITEGSATPETVGFLTVSSTTHPNQGAWYIANDAIVEWGVEEGTTITQFYGVFDQSPETNPMSVVIGTSATKEDLADGAWYFHLKGRQADGQFTDVVNFKLQIDTIAPNPIAPVVYPDQLSTDMTTEVRFGTTDETSGIDHYEIAFNNGGYTVVTSPLVLKELLPDTYLIEVKAVDKAGNASYGATKMRVYPPELYPGTDVQAEEGTGQSRLLIIVALGVIVFLAIIMSLKKILKRRT
ncbi:MAG: cohesin domain-containing protein [Patescibacteria group bacterium]